MSKRQRLVAVVDDDRSMLKATSDLLDAFGVSTALFASAEEFLRCGSETKFDCLLLDIHLGGMSGIELRQHLTAANCSLPVIFMTARDDEFIHEAARQVGCVTVLRKPYSAHQLMDAIQTAASGTSS